MNIVVVVEVTRQYNESTNKLKMTKCVRYIKEEKIIYAIQKFCEYKNYQYQHQVQLTDDDIEWIIYRALFPDSVIMDDKVIATFTGILKKHIRSCHDRREYGNNVVKYYGKWRCFAGTKFKWRPLIARLAAGCHSVSIQVKSSEGRTYHGSLAHREKI